jgi:creatinine amidohydrolase
MTGERTKLRMAELTGGEARALYPTNPVILLPMGSLEDHGPHAPMGDYLSADRIAEAMAARATGEGCRTLVAPVFPFGGNDYFGSVQGGIAMSQPTFRAVLSDMFACLLRHRLTRLIVITGHGGNVDALHQVTVEIRRSRGVVIPSLYIWRMLNPILAELLGAERAQQSTGHGADPVTSVAMHFFPDLMRPDLMPAAPAPRGRFLGLDISGPPTVRFDGVDIHLPLEIDAIAPNGVFSGDPRLCSADTGARIVDRLVAIGAGFIRHFVAATQEGPLPGA